MKPRLLDLYCCAGGAGAGYAQAGFEVVGVDINFQKNYPFEFHQADALEFLATYGHEFDAIHASPPCQAHSSLTKLTSQREHIDLIPETREALIALGKPWIIENVPGSPLRNPIMLCGTNFGLGVARHRYFESNIDLVWHETCDHTGKELYTVLSKSCRPIGDMRAKSSHEIGKKVMRVDWMTQYELGMAIPPAYTEYLGGQLLAELARRKESERQDELLCV